MRRLYKKLSEHDILVGIAVRKDEKGNILNETLNSLIHKADYETIYEDYLKFIKMPNSGIIK